MAVRKRLGSEDEHWIPLADLMTGLMFLFLLIAIAYMVQVQQQQAKAKQIAVLYQRIRVDLYADLQKEFSKDLTKWHAEIHDDLSINFNAPDVQFDTDKSDVKPKFKAILADFFPRYVGILTNAKYKYAVTEVRIEGYTSSEWSTGMPPKEAYINNMNLSQDRTRSVLKYVLGLPALDSSEDWLMKNVTANGLSSSHLVMTNGHEDAEKSQRVEFRVRTDADNQIKRILEASN